MSKLLFNIDGINFDQIGIIVSTVSGLVSLLEEKERLSSDDNQSHGKMYDMLSPIKYKEKEIVLNCYAKGKRLEVVRSISSIASIFKAPGTHRLTVYAENGVKLPYEVIRQKSDDATPDFNTSKNLAKFSLHLIENCPVKRVLVSQGGVVTLDFVTDKMITVSWGDGTYDRDLFGTVSLSKNIGAGNQILMIGDIEEINSFTYTNCKDQWDILF